MDHKSRKPRSSSSDALLRLYQLKLAAESTRADDAEQQATHLFARIRSIHKEKLDLQAELYKTRQELQLWQIQFEASRKEIARAQETLDRIERARISAEARADRNRQRVRRLLQEQAVQNAMDEGRRLGFQQGLDFGSRRLPRLPPVSLSRTVDSRQVPNVDPVVSSSFPPHSPVNVVVDPPQSSPHLSANEPRPGHPKAKKSQQSGFSAPPDIYISNVQGTGLPYQDVNATAEFVSPNDARSAPRQPTPSTSFAAEPAYPSPVSSTLSDLEIISPPRDDEVDQRWVRERIGSPGQSQSENIARRWKSQRDDILITASALKRKDPTSNNSHGSSTPEHPPVNVPPVAPRPATTSPSPSRPITTINNTRKPNEALPIQVSDVFYDPSIHQLERPKLVKGSPKEWLRSKFREGRKDSDISVPGIDIQPPSRSSTNTEEASFDPHLLTPGHVKQSISTSVAGSHKSDSSISTERERREAPTTSTSTKEPSSISANRPSHDFVTPVNPDRNSRSMFSSAPGPMAFGQDFPYQATLHHHAYPPIMPVSDIMVMRVGIPPPVRSPSPRSQSWTPATLRRPFSIFSDC